MTSVIQKYVTEGVLNYVDHETPRHYFLYDGMMEEYPEMVNRLIDDLCDENMELQKRVKDLETENKRLEEQCKGLAQAAMNNGQGLLIAESKLAWAVKALKKLNVGEGWAAQIARTTLAEIEGGKA